MGGETRMRKITNWDKDREIIKQSLVQANQTWLGKNYFSVLIIQQIQVVGNKKTNFDVLHPLFAHSASLLHSQYLYPPLSWHRELRMRMGLYSGGGSFSLLLLLIYFPCSRVGYFRKQIYSTIMCSTNFGKISSLWWSTSSLSCFSDVLFLVFLPSACPWSFSSILKTLSQRDHYLGPVVGLLQPAGWMKIDIFLII